MSFPRYPEYKDSGVEWLGDVPGHWALKPLWTHFRRVKRTGFETEQLLSVYRDYGVITKASRDDNFNKPSDDLSVYQLVIPGDLAINKMKAWQGSVAISEHRGIVSPAYFVYEALHTSDGRYLHYLMRSIRYITGYLSVSKGIRVNQWDLEPQLHSRMLLLIPPLTEQTQIAAFLDRETAKIDELVAEQRRLMDLLKEKRQTVISHAVTRGLNPDAPMKPSGNKWLGAVPAHWTACCLKHIKAEVKNAFVDGPFGSNLKSEHFIDDGDVYVIESNFATQGRIDTEKLKTISSEHFATINRSETRGGDIVIAKIGAQYGKASILPVLDRPAVVSGNSLKLTINQKSCDVQFVNWHLANLKELGVMEDIVNATAQPALSLGEMNNLPMLVPPKAEQQAIVAFLNEKLGEFDTLTAEAQHAIDLLQERRTALISAAVTGQIDVRENTQREESS